MSNHLTRRSAIRLAMKGTVVAAWSSALGCSPEPPSEYETKKGPSAEESVTRGRVSPKKVKTQEPATVQRSKSSRE